MRDVLRETVDGSGRNQDRRDSALPVGLHIGREIADAESDVAELRHHLFQPREFVFQRRRGRESDSPEKKGAFGESVLAEPRARLGDEDMVPRAQVEDARRLRDRCQRLGRAGHRAYGGVRFRDEAERRDIRDRVVDVGDPDRLVRLEDGHEPFRFSSAMTRSRGEPCANPVESTREPGRPEARDSVPPRPGSFEGPGFREKFDLRADDVRIDEQE